MRIGIVNTRTIAREKSRLLAGHYLSSDEEETRVAVARTRVRNALVRYRNAQSAARAAAARLARFIED